MTAERVLLVNPTITSPRSARFPLAVMQLGAALAGRHRVQLIDGNLDRDFIASTCHALREGGPALLGVSVMGGPQLPAALALSRAVRASSPQTCIVWGGYFATLCPDAALAGDNADFVVRGPGEATLAALAAGDGEPAAIEGLSWRHEGRVRHNPPRAFSPGAPAPRFDLLPDPGAYLGRTYLGRRTTGWQAALGCRYRCTFCGVAAMFRGRTALPPAERLDAELTLLKTRFGADSVQFYDHNFFDREADMLPLLQVLARHAMPWWCYARADALAALSDQAWALVRRSRLRMAYIGAESPNDRLLHAMRKGTQADQTLAAVEACRRNGVVPELSFMLAPPEDPEGETERSFDFIRRIKRLHPGAEVMLHIHTPLPPETSGARPRAVPLRDVHGRPVVYPTSAEGWAEPAWVAYWCHQDAPWLSERLRCRIRDFATVLGSRYPTITDIHTPAWHKAALRGTAAWRYRLRRYDRPWELDLMRRFIRLWDPRAGAL